MGFIGNSGFNFETYLLTLWDMVGEVIAAIHFHFAHRYADRCRISYSLDYLGQNGRPGL